MRTLTHLSDLHFFRKSFKKPLKALVKSLVELDPDLVLITGDLCDNGREEEYAQYQETFRPLIEAGKVSVLCGNHDRLNDDVARYMMNERVEVEAHKDLYLIKIDSTAPHNKFLIAGHGIVCKYVLRDVDKALNEAPKDKVVVVALHHHPIPLAPESLLEHISRRLGWPFAEELHLGKELIELCKGRADLLCWGHKHKPMEMLMNYKKDQRILGLYNAGSTPALRMYRVFKHKNGHIVEPPSWVRF